MAQWPSTWRIGLTRMARAFNVDARVSSFELPALTKQQIKALMSDLDQQDARSVIILAVAELWQREIGETQLKTYTYRDIAPDTLSATDLRAEAKAYPAAAAYRITIYDATGTRAQAETADALYVDGRLGIAWGADATWADVKDVESGIEMWLNDGEAWEAAN